MTIEKVMEVVKELTGQDATPETRLEDVVADSLEFMDIMVALDIPNDRMPHIETVKDLFMAVP